MVAIQLFSEETRELALLRAPYRRVEQLDPKIDFCFAGVRGGAMRITPPAPPDWVMLAERPRSIAARVTASDQDSTGRSMKRQALKFR